MSSFPLTPKIEKSTIVYSGYYDVRIDMLSLPDTAPISYTTLLAAPEASVVVAETKEGKLVINKEYRHPSGQWLYGLPGGRVDKGESPLATAQRELLEETGFEAESWHHLGTAFPLPAVCGQRIHYFLARGAMLTSPPQKEPLELITTLLLDEEQLYNDIRQGTPTDGILLAALTFHSILRMEENRIKKD